MPFKIPNADGCVGKEMRGADISSASGFCTPLPFPLMPCWIRSSPCPWQPPWGGDPRENFSYFRKKQAAVTAVITAHLGPDFLRLYSKAPKNDAIHRFIRHEKRRGISEKWTKLLNYYIRHNCKYINSTEKLLMLFLNIPETAETSSSVVEYFRGSKADLWVLSLTSSFLKTPPQNTNNLS